MKLIKVSLPSVLIALFGLSSAVCAANDEFVAYDNLSTLSSLGPNYLLALDNDYTSPAGTNLVTALVADDVRFVGVTQPFRIIRFSFYATNTNNVPVKVRPHAIFWDDDRFRTLQGRPTDTPGTLIHDYDLKEVTLPAAPAGSFSKVRIDYHIPLGGIFIPAGVTGHPLRIWAGVVFDNNNGATGATLQQMNGVGQLINDIDNQDDHLIVGHSGDVLWGTNNRIGSRFFGDPGPDAFGRPDPPGNVFDVTYLPASPGLDQPYANLAWRFTAINGVAAPEPGTGGYGVLGIGCWVATTSLWTVLGGIVRRRKA